MYNSLNRGTLKMEIIDAYWDDEILGLKCWEIVLNTNDDVKEFAEAERKLISEKSAQYIVVKAPVNAPEFLYELPRLDYTFLETAFKLTLKKQRYVCPSFVARFDRNSEVKTILSNEDLERVYSEISRGIFDTGRVALDKNFSKEQASRRYINWIQALIKQDQPVHEVYLDGNAVGFFVLKPVDRTTVQGILTGLYEKYEKSGFGVVLMKKLNDTVWHLGYETYLAQVGSNNLKALRSNLLFGSEIEGLTYNYVKFNK